MPRVNTGDNIDTVFGGYQVQDMPAVDAPMLDVLLAVAMVKGYAKKDRGHFLALYLNARSQLIRIEVVSVGTLSASLVHPREVFKGALLCNAAGVILAHNHPSGDYSPSFDDKETTKRLVRAGELLGIPVMDHIILGGEGHYSFRDGGLL